LTLNGLPRAR